MNKKNIFSPENLLFIFIIIQPIIDIISYFQQKFMYTSFTWIIRIIILFGLITYTFVNSNNKKKLLTILTPFLIYPIIHILNLYRVNQLNLLLDLKYYILVYQGPVLAILFISLLKNKHNNTKKIEQVISMNFFIIAISIILSIITGTAENTYSHTGLGVIGWFSGSNTPSMILCATTAWTMYLFSKSKKTMLFIIVMFLAFIMLYINATKACYVTLISTMVILLYFSILKKETKYKIKNSLIIIMLLSLSICLFGKSVTYSNKVEADNVVKNDQKKLKEVDEIKEESIMENLTEKYSGNRKKVYYLLYSSYLYRELIEIHGFEAVYQETKNYITADMLSNNRQRKVINAKIEIKNTDLLTKILGLGYSRIEKNSMDLENDLTAIIIYYGLIGSLIYFGIYFYIIYIFLKYLIKKPIALFDEEFVFLGFIILLLLVGAELSGALLRKPNASIYMSIFLALSYLKFSNTNYKKNTKKLIMK